MQSAPAPNFSWLRHWVLASSQELGFHPDPLEEPPSSIVCTGRRRSEPPHIEQAAPARSDLSGGHNPHGADPTTRPSMPPPPIRGQMVCRRRPGRRRRTQPRPLPEAGPAAAPATIAALGRGGRCAAAGQGSTATPPPVKAVPPRHQGQIGRATTRRGAPHRPHGAGEREGPRHRRQPPGYRPAASFGGGGGWDGRTGSPRRLGLGSRPRRPSGGDAGEWGAFLAPLLAVTFH